MNFKSILRYLSLKYWIVYIWLTAIAIYFGHLFFENGPITKYAQGIVDVINIMCLFATLSQINSFKGYSRRILKTIIFLTILFVLYTLLINESITVSGTNGTSISQLKLLLFSMTSIFPPVYFYRKGLLDDNVVKCSFFLLVLMSYLTFFSFRGYLQDLNGTENSVNNMGYLIVSLFPLSFLFKNPIRFVYWGLCLFIVFLGAKRGALLLASTLVVVSVFLSMRNIKIYQKIILLGIICFGFYYFFELFGDSFLYTLNRLQDSGFESHSRQDIQSRIIDGFLNGNPIHWFFGYGPVGSLHLSTNFAHNDWLEILADYGLLGFIPYLLFYIFLIKYWFSIRKTDYTLSLILLSALICCIFKSMLSMCFYSIENCVIMYAIGYVIAKKENNTVYCSTKY